MMFSGRRVVLIFNLFFSIIFLIHVSFLIYNILYPEVPEIIVYEKKLNEIDFPMNLRICVHDLNDETSRYRKFGYGNVFKWFMGKSMFNDTLHGWAGHSKNGSVLGNVEGLLEFFYLICCSF